MSLSLFDDNDLPVPSHDWLSSHAVVLRQFALRRQAELLAHIQDIEQRVPFRQLITPGGYTMSVGLSCCGGFGWITDRRGYRYSPVNPATGKPWPAMPEVFAELAHDAAAEAGFTGFEPDSCLINQYLPGAKMSLHQDKDERDFRQPIVSVSLGLPAMFLWGGLERSAPVSQVPLLHGDVMVWGGPDRLRFHGVKPIKPGQHQLLGERRINFTFRKAM